MSNLHPCANKCSEYKAEQCKSCLIQETKVQGVYVMGKADYMGDDAHIDKKKQCEPLQTEVARLNATIERQKAEMVVMQVQINELTAENAGLHQAATTHFRNQNHYMDLYHKLVCELYPYALDLGEPADVNSDIDKEYMDGYNRARECAHHNLMQMMKSDEEYICMQCDMLFDGGAA